MSRIRFNIKGVDEISFEYDSGDTADESEVDEEMLLTVLQGALERMETPPPPVNPLSLPRLHGEPPTGKPPKPSKGMQGSGSKVPGLERVECPSCGAAAGEQCFTGAGQRYYPGWGHQARIDIVAPERKRRH